MIISDEELDSLMRENGLITDEALIDAKGLAKREKLSLYEAVLRMDILSDENLGKLVANYLELPFVKLSDVTIPKEIMAIIPEVVARKQRIISFNRDEAGLHVAMADPGETEIVNFIKKKTGLPIVVHFASGNDIENAISLYSRDIGQVFDEIIKENIDKAKNTGAGQGADLPIIKIVDTIISYANQNRASDIHIEPQNENSVTRFRIDGTLHDIVTLPLSIHPQIVSRIKVVSKMRIDEHQSAQDGKFQFITPQEKLDIRVSVVPITKGEKVVMRLLSERSRQFSLESLGFSTSDLSKAKTAYGRPYGMLLSAGPTGSGKTTTMYAILKIINQRGVNISTIEDPVEYEMEGANQIQVNSATNLTFAAGLRSILRQDPNVILVGEIRDEETASIAISSAMTGHLVLSTIHANDAASSIPRLLDMGIEPFLLASTVNIIVAQRLVRKIHVPCRVSEEVPLARIGKLVDAGIVKRVFGKTKTLRIYKGKGCALDYGTGYEGRIGIFEVMVMNDSVREAIMARKDSDTIRKIAIKTGMKTMMEDGLEKVAHGLTTIEEVVRATKE
jgi:type IV pilus assembly protein PilB